MVHGSWLGGPGASAGLPWVTRHEPLIIEHRLISELFDYTLYVLNIRYYPRTLLKVSKCQSFKFQNSKIQSFKTSRFQYCEIQRLQDSKSQSLKVSKFQSCPASKFQSCIKFYKFQSCAISELQWPKLSKCKFTTLIFKIFKMCGTPCQSITRRKRQTP